jgi:hypothetical protein
MAKATEPIPFDDEWPLLFEVRAFVAQYCKSASVAEQLILDHAKRGHFRRYRWHEMEGGPSTRGISPDRWGVSKPEIGLHIIVDFDNSTVTYLRVEPGSYAFTLALEDRLEGFLPPPSYQIRLVRLHCSEVLSMLRAVGLLPPLTELESKPAASLTIAVEPELVAQAVRNHAGLIFATSHGRWPDLPKMQVPAILCVPNVGIGRGKIVGLCCLA